MRELAAARPIDANEVRIAEIAGGDGAIFLAARLEIATGEAAEHGGTAGLHPFALQRVVNLLDGIHGWNLALSVATSKTCIIVTAACWRPADDPLTS